MSLLPIFACILYFNGRAREDQQFSSVTVEKIRVEDLYAKPLPEENEEKK
jgi:hypothetical protein